MNIDIRDEALVAGEASEIGGYGQQFLLMESSANVDIIFLDAGRNKVGEAKNVPSGLAVKFEKPFALAVVKSAVNQSVKVAFASIEAEFNRLAGQITANITQANIVGDLSKQTLNTVTPELIVSATADAGRRFIFTADRDNVGSIYIGGAGVSADQCALILDAGDSYIETYACAAAFYAIADNDGDKVRVGFGALLP